jgi:hypothetical protein
MKRIHQCPRCHKKWECVKVNNRECPFEDNYMCVQCKKETGIWK